jgi:N-acetylglucosamine-6-sulfatase
VASRPSAGTRTRGPVVDRRRRWRAALTSGRLLIAGAIVAAVALAGLGREPNPPATGPNVILILTDDMRADDLQYMPNTLHLLGDQGVTFRQMLSPYPLCCPARAELLSGQYSHNNGVEGNAWPRGGYYKLDNTNTLPVWLHDAGYETAFMGKYLNEYGSRDPLEIPPGWDNWDGSVGAIYDYHHLVTNQLGQVTPHPRIYQTSLFDARTTGIIDAYAHSDRPFFLWTSFVTPHQECSVVGRRPGDRSCWHAPPPAYGDIGSFDNLVLPDDPSVNEADMSDKGRFMQRLPLLGPDRLATLHQTRILRIEALQSVDRAVAHLVAELKATGQYDNTYLMFTSDNGIQLGEHRWVNKILGYEPSVRVPLILTGPGIPAGVVRDQAVTMVDLAATIDDITGTTPDRLLDGESLLPLARGDVPDGRDRVVPLEAGPLNHTSPGWLYRGVRTDRYTLLVWRDGDVELYDRRSDPYEMRSVAGQPSYAGVQTRLQHELHRLKDCQGAACLAWWNAPTG